MNKTTISFSGIHREADQGISQDGECMELINAKVLNNSVQPVGRPILEYQFSSGRTPVFIHKNTGYEHFITYSGSILYYECKKEDGSYTSVNQQITSLTDLVKVESIGNTLVIIRESGISYALFKNSSYTYLGNTPTLPVIEFGKSDSKEEESLITGSFKLYEEDYDDETDSDVESFRTACTGGISKAMAALVENGFIYKVAFIRYALRLYDGSLIKHSGVTVLDLASYSGRDSDRELVFNNAHISYTWSYNSSGHYSTIIKATASVSGYKILYNIKNDMDISLWSDIVQSVDIYINLQSPFKSDAKKVYGSSSGRLVAYMPIIENLSTLFDDVSNFYFVKSIAVDDITESESSEEMEISSSVIENIVQQEAMDADNLTHHKITGAQSYVYNSRLHLGDITNRLFNGFTCEQQTDGISSGTTSDNAQSVVNINSDSGLSVVVSDETNIPSYNLSPVLVYPDTRAYKLKISTENGKGLTVSLKKHPFLNLSYHQTEDLQPHELVDDTTATMTTSESNTTEYAPNKIKVSELNNPFVFPAAQTYIVSNGTIMGMRAATMALSTNQYGQFPLYVFTTEGTYALQTGTGDVAYTNILTVSRDCCNNPSGIVSTDNAVVFPTNSGLIMISGSTASNISAALDGYLPSSIDSSPVIKKIVDIPGLWNAVSSTEFFHYLENALIGFNYEEKEIIVSNPNTNYSYIYGINTQQWHKTSYTATRFLNSYPECLALFSNNGLYDIQNRNRTINDVVLITRPVKIGTLTHKRILQAALRGVVRPALSDLYLRGEPVMFRGEDVTIFNNSGFYILGSNDAEHFTVIAGKDDYSDIRDVITKMNKTKAYKYFMFCLIGGVRTDVAFNYIELIVDESFTNRLR